MFSLQMRDVESTVNDEAEKRKDRIRVFSSVRGRLLMMMMMI